MIGNNSKNDSIDSRINKIRHYMKSRRLDFYMVFTSDPHLSEYISEADKFREYLTGFTGSYGTLVVSHEDAALWVDGRYFIQAEKETSSSSICIMKMGEKDCPTISEYIRDKSKLLSECTVGFDGRFLSRLSLEGMIKKLPDNVKFDCNCIISSKIWSQRPVRKFNDIRLVSEEYSGQSSLDKINNLRQLLLKEYPDIQKSYCYVISDLCSIMWLTNLRGSDIDYVPVAYSYMIISSSMAYLYINNDKLDADSRNSLEQNGIKILKYSDFYDDLSAKRDECIILDKSRNNSLIYDFTKSNNEIIYVKDSCLIRKDIKNEVEIGYMRHYHLVDAASVIRFIIDLKNKVNNGEKITEYEAAVMMDDFRRHSDELISLSFETISAYGKNAALPHYSAKEDDSIILEARGLYLVDCGGHYPSCTTDITRTIALGPSTNEEKKFYTAVLKGNLNLMNAVFIEGVRGENLDIIARDEIWRMFVDFRHGTGHGIGCELSVHEGPLAIRYRINEDNIQPAISPGMVVSDEPGVYFEGQFGIRLENELLVVKKEENEWGLFMGFEPLTLVPFDKSLIIRDMMTENEIEILNSYHALVYSKISPLLSENEKKWLMDSTSPL